MEKIFKCGAKANKKISKKINKKIKKIEGEEKVKDIKKKYVKNELNILDGVPVKRFYKKNSEVKNEFD